MSSLSCSNFTSSIFKHPIKILYDSSARHVQEELRRWWRLRCDGISASKNTIVLTKRFPKIKFYKIQIWKWISRPRGDRGGVGGRQLHRADPGLLVSSTRILGRIPFAAEGTLVLDPWNAPSQFLHRRQGWNNNIQEGFSKDMGWYQQRAGPKGEGRSPR